MKSITTFLLAAGAAIALSSQAGAAEPLLSPRAKANQPSKVVGGSDTLVFGKNPNALGDAAKAKASGGHYSVAGSSKNDPDLVRGQWARTGSPKGLQQLRESGREHQVAPLK
jgi:hypothetical protein